MRDGVTVSVAELIELKQLAHATYRGAPASQNHTSGNYQSLLKGRGMAFSEVRNYQAGDDIRHMEWRVTARTGRPHVKLYQEERERPILLIIDFNPSMYFGTRVAFKSVLAAKIAALIAWRAMLQKDKVGGLFFSSTQHHEFPPYARHAHIMKMLATLAEYTQALPAFSSSPKYRPLSDVLNKVRRVNKPGSLIVLLSDFYAFDEQSYQHLALLRQHNDVIACHIQDPIELALPSSPGVYPITDGMNTLLLDNDKTTQQAYQAYWSEKNQSLKKQLQRAGVADISFHGEKNLSQLLSAIFPRRPYG